MSREFLTWYVGEQIYGLDLERCKEVEKNLRLTSVPYSKSHIAGIVNLRGDVVTVIDLRKLLRKETTAYPEVLQIIRLKSNHSQIALIAEQIDDILTIDEKQLEAAGAHLDEEESYFIEHVVITKKGPLLILDSNRLIAAQNEN
ncbi:MAG: purine-binding chemotaxis protein CheW [Leptonema sp. (in: Bacteria)]|nr:purine-binding chemotaxis protein CheW [Leptonema sp. (in: bacteria)]